MHTRLALLFLAVLSLHAAAKDGGKSRSESKSYSSPAPAPYCAPSKPNATPSTSPAPAPSLTPSPSPSPSQAPTPSPAPAPTQGPSKPATPAPSSVAPVGVVQTPIAAQTLGGRSESAPSWRSSGATTGHPLTWKLDPIEHATAEPPQIVVVERVVEVPVEVVREVVIEVPGPERIVEVPVIVERTTNVCPVEEKKPAPRKPRVIPTPGVCK